MLGALVKAGEYLPRLRRYHRRFIILAGEFPHGIQRVEGHDRDEFNFSAYLAAQQLDISTAPDISLVDADKDLCIEQ